MAYVEWRNKSVNWVVRIALLLPDGGSRRAMAFMKCSRDALFRFAVAANERTEHMKPR